MSATSHPRAPFRWAIGAAAVLAALVVLQIASELRFAARRVGVTIDGAEAGGLTVLGVEAGSPAANAGLREKDRLLSLEAQPLRETGDFDRIAEGFRAGDSVRFEVVRDGKTLDARVVPGMPVDAFALVLELLVIAIYVALGLLAATRADEDRRATLLAAFSFAIALELALPAHAISPGITAVAVAVVFALVTGLQFGLELHLASLIPTTAPWLTRRPGLLRLFYGVGLGLGGLVALATIADELGVEGAAPIRAFVETAQVQWLLPIWAIAVTTLIGWRAIHHPEPRGRHQAGLVVLGLLPWVGIVLYETVRVAFGGTAAVPEAAWSLALLAYPLAIFAAIFLYQLFDLELVVRKTFLYATLTTLLVVGFYSLVGAGGALFARQFDGPGASLWVISAAALVMGLLFNPFRLRLERWIARKMFPERQALRTRLVALAAELPAQGKLARMGEHLARELARGFAVDPVAVWVAAPPQGQLVELASTGRSPLDLERTALITADDPAIRRLARDGRPTAAGPLGDMSPAMRERLTECGAELVVPLIAHSRLVGLLLLGRKRQNARFMAEELELLTFLSHHVATVFENARLFDSATYEGLTGLFRREAILEILDREWVRSHRYDRPLAVVVADLDHFKSVNDRFGHLGGDTVLQRVAAELSSMLRETDFIGRFGGEEFLIVLPETTLEGARAFAEKVRRQIELLELRIDGGEPIRVTVSLGVVSRAEVRGDTRVRARALIAAADEALYAAKNAGRNRVEIAVATL